MGRLVNAVIMGRLVDAVTMARLVNAESPWGDWLMQSHHGETG